MNAWLGLATLACVLLAASVASAGGEARVSCVKAPPLDKANAFYVSNKPPLAPSPFVKLPIGAITPRGWLRHMLELEAEGMTGRLTEISPWCKAEGNAWLSPEGKGHSPWEELPYWLKGFGDLGYVLRNERITAEARKWIEGIIGSQRDDGYFGPRSNLTHLNGKPDVWPNMIALNALQSFHEFTGDKRVLGLMAKYFKWQFGVPEADFLLPFWQQQRAGDNLESVYWLYNRTGDADLLKLAAKIHRRMARWDQGVANHHCVNFAQCFRSPALFWMQAKDDKLRLAPYRNYDTFMGEFGQQPGGTYGADENARKGYTDPRQATETCGMVEYMHSFQMLLKVTGDPLWADRCEEIAVNSFPCSQPPDQKGLHYLTAANQPRLDRRNHAPGIQNGGDMFSYNPHGYRCCQHNVSHGWPYYAEELWLATPDNGLCASLYAACEVEAKVGDGTTVKIAETTAYPFGEVVGLAITAAKPIRFPLYLRVPRWCAAPTLMLNGKPLEVKAEPLAFLAVEREWKDGDKLELTLPTKLSVRVWAKHGGAVSIERGPLAFSLKIGEEWRKYGSDPWPGFEVFPTTPWNYGLELDPANPEKSIEVEPVNKPVSLQPFTPEAAPITLRAKARKVPQWGFDRHALCATLQPSPAFTSEPLEEVTLIPMGCARLRISVFPTVSDKADAHKWAEQPQPAYVASASHCHPGDTTDALCDGQLPKSSIDRSIQRMTWWDHKGTAEWVAYRFPKPRTLTWSDVYWFDDTGVGGCRVPASWRLLSKEGNDWREVKLAEGSSYGVAKDAFNKVAFEPITTSELRLEVKLQPAFSGGILEWRVGDK
ncbi:MAG: transcriptional initiation protein Tat [Planctomycetes bacterium]|nr:transcriptional initiation protein Tat [Planctomycetota bacterium]